MNPPDLEFWARFLGVLALEIGAVVVAAALVVGRLRSASARRAVWQSAMILLGVVLAGEWTGIRGAVGRLPVASASESRPGFRWSVEVASSAAVTSDFSELMPEMAEMTDGASRVPAVVAHPVWWPGWVWLAGGVAVGFRAALIRLWLLRQRGRERAADRETERILEELAPTLGVRRMRVSVWNSLRGPVAFGVFRPTVAVPVDFCGRFDPDQRKAMLAHELAHLAGRDPAWLGLADILCALLWWHPGAWWVRRQFRAASEQVADAASSLVPRGAEALAESLLIFGREISARGSAPALGVDGGRFRSDLGRRVDSLLRERPAWTPSRRRDRIGVWALAAGCSAALFALPIPGAPQGSPILSLANAALAGQVPEVGITAAGTSPAPRIVRTEAPASPASPGSIGSTGSTGSPVPRLALELQPEAAPGSPQVKSGYVWLRDPEAPVTSPPAGNGEPMFTKAYHLEHSRLEQFVAAMQATEGVSVGTNRAILVREFFSLCGIEFPSEYQQTNRTSRPGEKRAIYLGHGPDGRKMLFVCSPLREQDRIERVIQGLFSARESSGSYPAITLEAHFAEVTEGGPQDIGLDWLFGLSPTNNPVMESVPWKTGGGQVETFQVRGQAGILSAVQYAALHQRLADRAGVDILMAPRVTTLSGRAAKILAVQARTIVTGVNARVDGKAEAVGFDAVDSSSTTNTPGVVYQTEQVLVGPELEVLPTVEGDRWRLDITARVTEFLGYDDPGADGLTLLVPTVLVPGGKPLRAQRPLPHFRRREMVADVQLRPDEVVALRGPSVETRTVRKGGLFRRDETKITRKRLYVFIAAKLGILEAKASDPPVQPLIVQVLPETDHYRLGGREVREFELSGVLRSLALTRPGLVLLIRSDSAATSEKAERFQDLARQLGIPNTLL